MARAPLSGVQALVAALEVMGTDATIAVRRATAVMLARDWVGLLPEELVLRIVSHLEPRSVAAMMLVSKSWHRWVRGTSAVWRRLCLRHGWSTPQGEGWRQLFRQRAMMRAAWRAAAYTVHPRNVVRTLH